MRTTSILFVAIGCAPPPEIPLPGDPTDPVATGDTAPEVVGPSIQILYPEAGQRLRLEPGCALTEPIIVVVEGLELSRFGDDLEGFGHWHGGPSLDAGYCMSWVAYCDGRGGVPENAEEPWERYDGQAMHQGLLTLHVDLDSNTHEPLGVEDQVEVELVPAIGEDCP